MIRITVRSFIFMYFQGGRAGVPFTVAPAVNPRTITAAKVFSFSRSAERKHFLTHCISETHSYLKFLAQVHL